MADQDGMYPMVRIPIERMTAIDFERANAQFDGLRDFDSELKAILAFAYRAAADETNVQGIRDNANLLKTMISHELPRLLGTTQELAMVLAVGRLHERIYAVVHYEQAVRIGTGQQKRGRKRANAVAKGRQNRRAKIKNEVEDRIRRRGRHKSPSDTKIYEDIAARFGVSIPTVRRAMGKK